jgi:hypothetical protein
MKRIFTVLAISICSLSAFAQNEAIVKNAVTVNAVGAFTGFYKLNYERVIGKKSSLMIGFGTGTLVNKSDSDADENFSNSFGSNFGGTPKNHTIKGYTVGIDYRYYFTHLPTPKGLYVSGGIHYFGLNERFEITERPNQTRALADDDYKFFNIKGLCGYQFLIAKRVVVNPYFGFGYIIGDVADFDGTENSIELGVNVGVGF